MTAVGVILAIVVACLIPAGVLLFVIAQTKGGRNPKTSEVWGMFALMFAYGLIAFLILYPVASFIHDQFA
jgi:ATP/ADP translocase